MGLPIDASRPVRTRAEQAALVEAVRNASTDEQETNYLEWKGTLDLANKASRAKIAKAVLGFSNRRPDVAERACGGCAYLLVGVEPGVVAGVEPVDAAKLESGLVPYVGTGVQWRPDYVEVDGRKVLIVAVEPPRWGDPAHPVRKSFSDGEGTLLQEGEVFVRHHASTDPRTAADVDDLSRRAARRTDNDLAIGVRWLGEDQLLRVDLREETLASVVGSHRVILMRSVNSLAARSATSVMALTGVGESRSPEVYTREVDEYVGELFAALPDALRARSALHNISPLRLGVVNESERSFTGVRLELHVPSGIGVFTWKPDVKEQANVPNPPATYGELTGEHWYRSPILGNVPQLMPQPHWVPDSYSNGATTRVVYADTEVRAEGTLALPVIWLVLDHDAPDELLIEWEATAKEANKRLRGTVTIPVSPTFVSADDLLENPPNQD